MTNRVPVCPKCASALKLNETKVKRIGGADAGKFVTRRQWICTGERCAYNANHHVHA